VAELEGGAWRCIATSVQELEAVGTQLTTSRRAADLEVASAVRFLACLQGLGFRVFCAVLDESKHLRHLWPALCKPVPTGVPAARASQTAAVLRVNTLPADVLIRCCRQILEEAVPEAVEAAEAVLRREQRREREVRSLGLAAGADGGFGRCAPASLPLSFCADCASGDFVTAQTITMQACHDQPAD